MPPKRKIANISTGGTGDVRPQLLAAHGLQAVLTQEELDTFPTPVPRSSFEKDLAQVMEVLTVSFTIHHSTISPIGLVYAILSTTVPGNAIQGAGFTAIRIREQMSDPRVIAAIVETTDVPIGTSIAVAYPKLVDLRDGVGHGVLVATDTLFLTFGATAAPGPIDVSIRILYRMVNVGIMEYVGIVQS